MHHHDNKIALPGSMSKCCLCICDNREPLMTCLSSLHALLKYLCKLDAHLRDAAFAVEVSVAGRLQVTPQARQNVTVLGLGSSSCVTFQIKWFRARAEGVLTFPCQNRSPKTPGFCLRSVYLCEEDGIANRGHTYRVVQARWYRGKGFCSSCNMASIMLSVSVCR